MADEIQIKAASTSTGSSQPVPPADASSTGGIQPVPPAPATSQALPVIDLREMEQTATPSAPPPSLKPQNPQAISLGGDDPQDDESQYVVSGNQRYPIPELVREKFPDLIQLIKETESMNDEEREYWYQILPIMTEDQIQKFREILVNEKEQLARLDSEYQEELSKLNEKHMIEWKNFESKEKRKALTMAEQQAKSQEQAEEEQLLARLRQV